MSKPNVCLYFDDFRGVGRLPDADRGKLFSAILAFSEFGEEPDFGEAALLGFAWDSIKPKLVADDERYKENSEKKRYATYCRDIRKTGTEPMPFDDWRGSADNSRYQAVSDDIRRYPYSYSYSASSSSSFPSSSSVSSSEAEADTVIRSAAAAILQDNGVPVTKGWTDALDGDLQKHGEEAVRHAMQEAVHADKFGGVSINFYRSILNGTGAKKALPSQDGYMKRKYTDEYFDGLAVDFDKEEG